MVNVQSANSTNIKSSLSSTASNNHSYWTTEDCQTSEAGASGQEVGSLLRIWSCCSFPPYVHLCPHCSLAGLYLVRHR